MYLKKKYTDFKIQLLVLVEETYLSKYTYLLLRQKNDHKKLEVSSIEKTDPKKNVKINDFEHGTVSGLWNS